MRKGSDYDSERTVTVSPNDYRARLVTLLVRVQFCLAIVYLINLCTKHIRPFNTTMHIHCITVMYILKYST